MIPNFLNERLQEPTFPVLAQEQTTKSLPLLLASSEEKQSALDRVNIRRVIDLIKRAISDTATQLLFEINDDLTQSAFKYVINPFLADIQKQGGIDDYLVVCDETNNTPADIDANRFVADIFIKPPGVNFIQLNCVAQRTGVGFNELV